MGESGRLEEDPVCGMMVGEWENQYVHRGIGYAFCSQQCRERFVAAPGLYVGKRGWLAPKQKGMQVIKRRCMALASPLTQSQFIELQTALLSMMGVIVVRSVVRTVDRRRDPRRVESETPVTQRIEAAEVSYDLLQATAAQLERKCAELNAVPRNRWGEKLLRDFIHYIEECELEDLQSRAGVPAGGDQRTRSAASEFQGGARLRTDHRRRDLGG